MRIAALYLLVLACSLGIAAPAVADDAEKFNDFLKYTQDVVAKQHLIVNAHIEFDNPKKKPIEFRYDHYPEIERMQSASGGAYVRKSGGEWVKSDDWGETSKPASRKATDDFDNWISLVNVPINNIHEERDKSQGGVVPTLLEGEGGEDKEIVFELRREHSTNFGYPRFGFLPFGGKALLHSYNGMMHYGPDHITAHMRYDFMFMVNIQEATPSPAGSSSSSPSSSEFPSSSASGSASASSSLSAASPAPSPALGGTSSSRPNADTAAADDQNSGGEEVIKAACRKMKRGTWKVDAKLTFKKKLGITGLINGADFDLTTHPSDGAPSMRQVTIVTLSWLTKDGGKTWSKTDARDRGIYNWVHSPLIGNDMTPPFEIVGTERHGKETWQHLQLKPDEKVDDPSRLPAYWIALDDKGEPLAVRRFAGPVIISGEVVQAEIDYALSKEPFISPPNMARPR